MSADTKAALDAAIAAHIADEYEGSLAGAWVVVTETTTLAEMDDGTSSWAIETKRMQSTIMTDGLLYAALNRSTRVDDD